MPPPLLHLDAVAEERIQEAIRRGELDGLPGAGKPLVLDEDPLVPAELRVANRILSNAGLVPIAVLERREIADLEAGLTSLRDDKERSRVLARLALLRLRIGPRRAVCLSRNAYYERRIMAKLAGG
jgi:DnaJ homologue, subfamily C, member 28, conserved domain